MFGEKLLTTVCRAVKVLIVGKMVEDAEKKTALSGMLNPTQISQKVDPARKRYQRCKIAALAEYGPREINETEGFLRSSLHKYDLTFFDAVIMMVFHLTVGSISFYLVRDQITGVKTDEILDSVYLSIVTMTTVGYGDLVPNSVGAKVLSSAFVFSGMALVCIFLTTLCDRLFKKHAILLVKAMQMPRKADPSEILKEVETNRVRDRSITYLMILILHIVAGTVTLSMVEKLSIIDAFYCVISTITTLGYGDKSFSTFRGRIFASFWILSGTISVGQNLCFLAIHTVDSRQKALVEWILSRKMTNADLEAADIIDDGIVSAAEIALYKLKKMGKISQEDISLAMDEFENIEGNKVWNTLSF